MKIVCLDGYTLYPKDDPRWARFNNIAEFEIYDRTSPDQVVPHAKGAAIVLTNKVVIDARAIAALPDLRYIGVLATGFNVVDIEAARKACITVCNIPAYSTQSVAQLTFALLLAIANRVETYATEISKGKWSACEDFTYRDGEWPELAGKTFGIVGFGNIGQAVAKIAAGFGMKVALYTSKAANDLPSGYAKMELDELFASCDVISLHCPLTPDTKQMVDSRRLSLMKPSAILLNASRGQIVDEQALANALNEGRIFGAGLDVLVNEPPRKDCPLLTARNCFITPHIAWASTEARERLLNIAFTNVQAYIDGKPINVVS
ncbi:MAG: D-2-hydroxyacid dehydrogenase [Muribaculaceae bacterium]|nr:D-2-hydroxyacid dehydrogenase [Muribaculaceae bacterium]